jgi:hypothetical protein
MEKMNAGFFRGNRAAPPKNAERTARALGKNARVFSKKIESPAPEITRKNGKNGKNAVRFVPLAKRPAPRTPQKASCLHRELAKGGHPEP